MTKYLFAGDQYGYNFLALLDTTVKKRSQNHIPHDISTLPHTDEVKASCKHLIQHTPRCAEFAETQFEGFFVRWQRKGTNNFVPSL